MFDDVPDQAAGLRRMFASPGPRLLPVVVPDERSTRRTALIAQLSQSLTQAHGRVLLLDAARLNIAGSLGLRARFDLLHALLGEWPLASVVLDAAPGLSVVPACRAFEEALDHRIPLADLLEAVAAQATPDIVVIAATLEHAPLLRGGEVMIPTGSSTRELAGALATIHQLANHADTRLFRLVFIDTDAVVARTLSQRIAESVKRTMDVEIALGGTVGSALDVARLATEVRSWRLAQLQLERESVN